MLLRLRHAEFEHIVAQSRKRDDQPGVSGSPDSVELWDVLDSMPLREVADVVALLLVAQSTASLDFSRARMQAADLCQEGVELLHRTLALHKTLLLGLDQVQSQAGEVTWADGGS